MKNMVGLGLGLDCLYGSRYGHRRMVWICIYIVFGLVHNELYMNILRCNTVEAN